MKTSKETPQETSGAACVTVKCASQEMVVSRSHSLSLISRSLGHRLEKRNLLFVLRGGSFLRIEFKIQVKNITSQRSPRSYLGHMNRKTLNTFNCVSTLKQPVFIRL